MDKIYPIINCAYCPYSTRIDDVLYCKNQHILLGYKKITREEQFVLDENGNALDNRFPKWCELKELPNKY